VTIFISIASYRDPELERTIHSALDNAVNPQDLHFGVMLQEFEKFAPDLSWVPNLTLKTIHPKMARGAGYARAEIIPMYSGQDYFLQIDSHTIFEKNWDQLCIDQYKKAQDISKNNKIILSYFPPPFYVESNKQISIIKNSKTQLPYATKQKPMLTKRGEWTAERVKLSNKNLPEESTTILAGFVFAAGELIQEVPYDPEISFFGEELCFAIRAWTRGWDIYSPCVTIVYHFYVREGYSKVWKDRNLREISWKELELLSKQKQKRVLCGIEGGIWGAGSTRTLAEYEKLTGLDFKKMYNPSSDTIVVREKE
jgi:hypothetical protein